MIDEVNRWYKIGFDEACLAGNEFDPPREKPQSCKDAYRKGWNARKALG